MPIVSNIQSELDGLGVHVTTATTGAITRPVVVLTDIYDRFYGDKAGDTFPYVLLQEQDWRLDRLFGGNTGQKGQAPDKPSWYSIQIQDQVVLDDTGAAGLIAASKRDIRAIITAIVEHFDHKPNRTMPMLINNVLTDTCSMAGEYIRFRFAPPPSYQAQSGESARIVAAGLISVCGIPRPGSLA